MQQDLIEKEERTDRIVLQGEVQDASPGALFKVLINEGNMIVNAVLSGKMRQNRIRVLPGDRVTVEVSPYDVTRGRITWRG